MRKFLMQLFTKQTKHKIDDYDPQKLVDYSVEQYKETYKLLEEYDKQTPRATAILATPGPLRKALQGN